MPKCFVVLCILLDIIHEFIVHDDIFILVIIDSAMKVNVLGVHLVLFLMIGNVFHNFGAEALSIILLVHLTRSCRLMICIRGMGLGALLDATSFSWELTVSTGTCSPWATLGVGLGWWSVFVSPWFSKGEKESQPPCSMADLMIRGMSASTSKGSICLFLEAGSAAVQILEQWMTFRVSSVRMLHVIVLPTCSLTPTQYPHCSLLNLLSHQLRPSLPYIWCHVGIQFLVSKSYPLG